jgi:hypothetical protein
MTGWSLWYLEHCLVSDTPDSKGTAVSNTERKQRTISEVNTLCLEIPRQGQDDRVVLIERRTVDPLKSVDSRNLLNEAMEVSPELYRTVPWLESEPRQMSFPGERWQRELMLTW